jgi:hypothetical protein
MAYAQFSTNQSYNVGDTVLYEGVAYTFLYPHTPGDWNILEVLVVTPVLSYASKIQDFNTLPDYNLSRPLPPGKFRVNYFVNNDDINIPDMFVSDNNVYLPGELASVLWYPYTHYSQDGVWAYTFNGWSLTKGMSGVAEYYENYEITMQAVDINLYGCWIKTPTINVNSQGAMTLKTEYKNAFSKLVIPEYFGGIRIKRIGHEAFLNSSINEIVIPPSIIQLDYNAFNQWSGSIIRFIDADITIKYPGLKLSAGCFTGTPNLVKIILPYRWIAAGNNPNKIFIEQPKADTFNIYIRNSKNLMNELLDTVDAELYITDNSNPSINYIRNVYWGYND